MIVAVIQARMKSTRLPGKAMLPLNNKPIIEHIIERVKLSFADKIVLALPNGRDNDPLAQLAVKHKILGVIDIDGSESDVVGRFVRSIPWPNVSTVIRITGDCPLVDADIINDALGTFLQTRNCDYVYSCPKYPEGTDVEVMSYSALRYAYDEAKDEDREHVTSYITNTRNGFRCVYMPGEFTGKHNFSVDTLADYELIRDIFIKYGDSASWRNALEYVSTLP
jgi:spore coat polysaccharide biosynthesis protein SpsF (cytidylyltransferase family)